MMDEQAKKAALLMIPYGLYVLSAKNGDALATGTVNWVTQASFKPPLVAMGVKKDSGLFAALKGSGTFFRHVEPENGKLGVYAFHTGDSGGAILEDAPAWVEGAVTDIIERGDHAVVIGEVTHAGVNREAKVLTLEECGVQYGG